MTYVHNPPPQNHPADDIHLPSPELMLATAREAYHTYCQLHIDAQPPSGIAMDRNTGKGQLIFSEQPILLPHEFFITADQMLVEDSLESEDIKLN